MNNTIFAYDLGANSIGWAVINPKTQEIISCGSSIFPEGVNISAAGKEESKNATRRIQRQTRKVVRRRKQRKIRLVKILKPLGLFPQKSSILDLEAVWLNDDLKSFFTQNPYELRNKAIKGEKLSKLELGRVIYHFAQRRGYRESLKDADGLSEKSVLNTGDWKNDKTGIVDTNKGIAEKGSLGAYLFSLDPHKERIRNRYTNRKMYIAEFYEIWNKQKPFYPNLLSNELFLKIGDKENGLLFYQRPIQSQKHLVGKCTFEPSKGKANKSCFLFEEMRAWQQINQLTINEEKLDDSQRQKVFEKLIASSDVTILAILKTLKLTGAICNYKNDDKFNALKTIYNFRKVFGNKRWNSFTEEEKDKIWQVKYFADNPEWLVNYARKEWQIEDENIIKQLLKFSLPDGYANLSRKAISRILPWLQKGYLYDDAVLLGGIENAFGASAWDNLSAVDKNYLEEKALELKRNTKIGGYRQDLEDLLAAEYLLPKNRLRKLYHHSQLKAKKNKGGLPLIDLAMLPNTRNPIVQQVLVELAKLTNSMIDTFGLPSQVKIEMARELKQSKDRREAARSGQKKREAVNDEFRRRLEKEGYKVNSRNIQKLKLWDECGKLCPYTGNTIGFADLFGENPIYEVEHIVPRSVSFNDSLQNKTLCRRTVNQQKGNKTPFEFYSGDAAKWAEVKLRAKSLFAGKNFDKYKRFIAETIPDLEEFKNRQLTDTAYLANVAKDMMEQICQDVIPMPGGVTAILRQNWGLNSLLNKTIYLGDGYNTPNQNGAYVIAINSNNKVLDARKVNTENKKKAEAEMTKKGIVLHGTVNNGKFYPSAKNRNDHRHHALDAIVVACTTRQQINEISRIFGQENKYNDAKERIQVENPFAWHSFRHDVAIALNNILVWHKQNKRSLTKTRRKIKQDDTWVQTESYAARGALHKETIYGKHDWAGQTYFHVRKPLEALTDRKHIDDIVDAHVRKQIVLHLKSIGVDTSQPKYKVPKGAFFKFDEASQAKIPLVFMPNKKDGTPMPIKKVRTRRKMGNMVNVKDGVNKFVDPRNNHHVEIYYNADTKEYKEEIVTLWEAVESKKQGFSAYGKEQSKAWQMMTTLHKNDMFLLGWNEATQGDIEKASNSELSKYLFRVQKLSSMYYTFRHHLAATIMFDEQMIYIVSFGGWKKQTPIKVSIDRLGNIRKVKM